MPSWKIADSVRLALHALDVPDDPLPADLRQRHGLYGYADALRGIHRPGGRSPTKTGPVKRLKWDEAFTLQVLLAQRRRAAADHRASPRPPIEGGLLADFDASLPFELTQGQQQGQRRRSPTTCRRDHPDAPAAAGRGRLGQDGDRDAGDAAGRRRGRAGRAAGADRGARAAALPLDLQAAGPARHGRAARRRRARHQADAADRLAGHRGPAQGAARSRIRWCRAS